MSFKVVIFDSNVIFSKKNTRESLVQTLENLQKSTIKLILLTMPQNDSIFEQVESYPLLKLFNNLIGIVSTDDLNELSSQINSFPKENNVKISDILIISSQIDIINISIKAKIKCVAVSYSSESSRNEIYQNKPSYLCDNSDELLNLLKQESLNNLDEINKNPKPILCDYKSQTKKVQEELVEEMFEIYQTVLKGRTLENFEKVALYDKMNPDDIKVVMWKNKIGKNMAFFVLKRHDLFYPNINNKNNNYSIFKLYVCCLPDIAGNSIQSFCLKNLLSDYHQINPAANIIVFEYCVNYQSYKRLNLNNDEYFFPYAGENHNKINEMVNFLNKYFNFEVLSAENPYLLRTMSSLIQTAQPPKSDKIGSFYLEKTQNMPGRGLLGFSIMHLGEKNSLGLKPFTADWLKSKEKQSFSFSPKL